MNLGTVEQQEARIAEIEELRCARGLTPSERAERDRLEARRSNRLALDRVRIPLRIAATREKLAQLEARARELRIA